jgi:hypothetical protein
MWSWGQRLGFFLGRRWGKKLSQFPNNENISCLIKPSLFTAPWSQAQPAQNWLQPHPEQRTINRGCWPHSGSNDSRVSYPAPTPLTLRQSFHVFLQDQGEGTHKDLHGRLHHGGTGPRCPMGSPADGMSQRTPLWLFGWSSLGVLDPEA